MKATPTTSIGSPRNARLLPTPLSRYVIKID